MDVITSRWRVGYDEGKVGDILPKSLTERRSFEKVRAGYQTKQKLERPRKSSYKQEEQIKSCGEKTRGTVVSFNKIRHEVSNDGPISIQRIISVLRLTRPQSSSRYPSHLAFPCGARRTIWRRLGTSQVLCRVGKKLTRAWRNCNLTLQSRNGAANVPLYGVYERSTYH